MDVAGAFNNVHHQRLIHDMKKRKVPEAIVKWTESFLKNRTTQLRFNGSVSDKIAIGAGIPQGSPMSPLLYMYYNADLLDVSRNDKSNQSWGFIDDIAYGVQGHSDKGNAWWLSRMLMEAETWRSEHGAKFETSKYTLVHFTRNWRHTTEAAIEISGTVIIQPSQEAQYLGVISIKAYVTNTTSKTSPKRAPNSPSPYQESQKVHGDQAC